MIRTSLFAQAHLDELKRALTVYAGRHRVVADNIANVETPGYRAQELRFEELLAGSQRRLAGVRTHAAHLPVGQRSIEDVPEEIVAQDDGFDNGTNDVDIYSEMTELATTDLSYRLATRLLSMKYAMLRSAVTGQVR
jgi:flagellar basal-body rod protein FlgB